MRNLPSHHRLALALAGPIVLLLLAACADGTAPTGPTAPLAPTAPRASIEGETRSFIAGADTTLLEFWSADVWSCDPEVRSVGASPNPNLTVARGLYLARSGGACSGTENVPLIEFRPHDNTREYVAVELYNKNIFGILHRGLSASWFYYQNGLGQQQHLDFSAQVTLRWNAQSYPVASRAASPSAVTLDAGTATTLVSHAYAPNGIEIYNQPTSGWTSDNSAVATVSSDAGVQSSSPYGWPWYNWTNTVVGQNPGTTTVSFVLAGQTVSVPVTVTPTATLSGDSWLLVGNSNSFSVQAGYCGDGCTMHWVRYFSSTGVSQDLGTYYGTSSSVDIVWTGMGSSELYVDVTANGVTKNLWRSINEQVDSSCDPTTRDCWVQ